jgi:hypothetical protein
MSESVSKLQGYGVLLSQSADLSKLQGYAVLVSPPTTAALAKLQSYAALIPMSTPLGSAFGKGPFGRGPYSAVNKVDGAFALRSASRLTVGAVARFGRTIKLASRSSLAVSGHVMWAALDVPPCQPWTLVQACGCPSWVVWPE